MESSVVLSPQEKLDRLRELGFEPKFSCAVTSTEIDTWHIWVSIPKLYIRDASGLFYYMDSGNGPSPAEAIEKLWNTLVGVITPKWLGTEESDPRYDFRLNVAGQRIPRESF